jgi:hypothetical protein
MLNFYYHSLFEKETAKLKKGRFINIDKGIEDFKRLCEIQFHPVSPMQIISPGKIHRCSQNAIWSLWKVELVIPKSGLRPNQFPRLWFAVKGAEIALLVIVSHIDNYSDNEMDKLAVSRISDIF